MDRKSSIALLRQFTRFCSLAFRFSFISALWQVLDFRGVPATDSCGAGGGSGLDSASDLSGAEIIWAESCIS
jgi:hypothetical protein